MAKIDLLPKISTVRALAKAKTDALAEEAIRGMGGRVQFVSGATVVSFAGVRASATAGTKVALEGWIRAAYRKLDRQAIARMSK